MKPSRDSFIQDLDDKYRPIALLGEGGTAKVWLAVAQGPSGFSKLVVLKTIRGELFNEQAVIDMFLEEARLAARLNHPNIVQTNEVFERGGQPVIVMEYLDGLPFSVILERQREGSALALAMLLRVVSDALMGLHAAHELRDYDGSDLGVVHRDISPHNLFVTFAGQVKVLDFGIAQLTNQREVSETGILKGKLRYMAPEQIRSTEQIQNTDKLDRRADLYAMGVVLWEIAAQRRMWEGIPEPQIKKNILENALPRLQEVAPDIEAGLLRVVNRALTLDPEDRYETALEFQSDLEEYISTLGAPLKNSDLGRALSKMFDDVRKERSLTIETQLSRTSATLIALGPQNPLPELTSFSNIRLAKRPPLSTRLTIPALILGGLLCFGCFLFALWWPALGENTKPPSPITPAQETVRIRITAFPMTAQLLLDGTPLNENPSASDYEKDNAKEHIVDISAEGYLTQRYILVFDQNRDLVAALVREDPDKLSAVPETEAEIETVAAPRKSLTPPAPVPPASRIAPKTPPLPQPAGASTAGASDCSPPYYYDARGIKKYRPECL